MPVKPWAWVTWAWLQLSLIPRWFFTRSRCRKTTSTIPFGSCVPECGCIVPKPWSTIKWRLHWMQVATERVTLLASTCICYLYLCVYVAVWISLNPFHAFMMILAYFRCKERLGEGLLYLIDTRCQRWLLLLSEVLWNVIPEVCHDSTVLYAHLHGDQLCSSLVSEVWNYFMTVT